MINAVEKFNIAIDGYSSCGKSTLAKALANKLGFRYIDTGAMYRATTLYFMRKGLVKKEKKISKEILLAHLDEVNVSFSYNSEKKISETLLNGENVEKEIRMMEVSENVSQVSVFKEIREKMVALQQRMGQEKGVVMEGRDIGTVVFPDAELKLFMTADIAVRVQRRLDELHSKGEHVSEDEVKANLLMRDHEDTHRKENPLRQAKDAIVLDNSELNPQQQLDYVLRLIEDKFVVA